MAWLLIGRSVGARPRQADRLVASWTVARGFGASEAVCPSGEWSGRAFWPAPVYGGRVNLAAALLAGLAVLVLAEVFAHGVGLHEDVESTI